MADIATSEIQLYGLPTKTVNLTPSGGTVVREITTKIQPGLNEITVLGLDPSVDVDSIRIEGSGPAAITDIQTEIVPRRELFEDVYGEDESEDNSANGSDYPKSMEMVALQATRERAEERLEKARNEERIAVQVLEFMDAYSKKMQPENTPGGNLEDFIERYIERSATENERRYNARMQASKEEQKVDSVSKQIRKLELQSQRSRDKIQREHAREKSQETRKRQEQRRFWTASVGQVIVHLDSHPVSTPGSSRRSSVSVAEKVADNPRGSSDNKEVTLRLSYVVPGAKWISRYELSINTPPSTAQLTYSAEFQNKSSEIWSDARVTLSTSQTSFSGLHESIPSLQAWHVKLIGSNDGNEQPSWENIIRSLGEGRPVPNEPLLDYQAQLASLEQNNKRRLIMARQQQDSQGSQQRLASEQMRRMQQMQQMQIVRQMQQQQQMPVAPQQQMQQQMQMAPQAPRAPQGSSEIDISPNTYYNDENTSKDDNDDDEISSPPNLEYQDSIRQEYGLTTTYDLPGHRTVIPSSVNRRHALAKLDFNSVTLQHVIVPKQRAAAFFRARIRNTSSIQILPGRVGMTVDGAFLGTTKMPSCASNDFFDISMGVDPSILVTYAKPTVRRETGGFFMKDDAAIFRRSCWVKNTKSTAAHIFVTEQVPMSTDEKLQMAILEPKGLAKEGDQTAMAVEADKGKGVVALGKDGEVKWLMQLEPGKDVRVVLEYEMKAPRGNDVRIS